MFHGPRLSGWLMLLFLAIAPGIAVHASRGEDSLHTVLHGATGPGARARALLVLAERFSSTKPLEALAHTHTAMQFAEKAGDEELQHELLSVECTIHKRLSAYDELLNT